MRITHRLVTWYSELSKLLFATPTFHIRSLFPVLAAALLIWLLSNMPWKSADWWLPPMWKARTQLLMASSAWLRPCCGIHWDGVGVSGGGERGVESAHFEISLFLCFSVSLLSIAFKETFKNKKKSLAGTLNKHFLVKLKLFFFL